MDEVRDLSFACAHWAIGTTVLVGLAASEYSGAGTVIALPIAVLAVTLSGICGSTAYDSKYHKRKICDAIDFFVLWLEILGYLSAAATCARIASATVDYMSRERFRSWLLGLESHSLGEPWPDIFGVIVIIVISLLFMLGLEAATTFSCLMVLGIASSFIFFIIVGGVHADTRFWNWREDFMLRSWKSILTTSAMCAYGFLNNFHRFRSKNKWKLSTFALVPLLLYSSTALTFTFMSHYREVAGTAIPLVRVFEVRDVDWARPVMAAGTICVVCVALTEIMPILYSIFMRLATKEWDIFVSYLRWKSSFTGAPILAIFAAGSLAAILAFACPLNHLIKILNVSVLLKCALQSSGSLYNLYRPESNSDTLTGCQTNIQYSKLNGCSSSNNTTPLQRMKTILTMPKLRRKKFSKSKGLGHHSKKNTKDMDCDKEYLLLDEYSRKANVNLDGDSYSESGDCDSDKASEADDSSSSTDIDAAVQEYKDTVQVRTVSNFNERRQSTKITSRIVAIFTFLIFVLSIFLAVCVMMKFIYSFWCSIGVIIVSTIVILFLPQNFEEKVKLKIISGRLFPVCAVISIVLNNLLMVTLIEDVWPGLIFWFLAGLLLFLRCDCCTCDGLLVSDNVRIHPTLEQIASHQKDTYIDTILISR